MTYPRFPSNVVVVGTGPVGMTTALGLARRGVPVTILEAGDDLATESRASTFHPPSLDVLRELGVVDELLELGLKAPGFQYRGHQRELIAHLDMNVLADDTDFPFRLQCEQSKLTRVIRRRLEAMPHVTLRFGAPVDRVEVGTDTAHVFLVGDGFEPSYTADWVLGADGANSAVRRSLGIAFEGVTYPERFLVASTTHDFYEDLPDLAPVSYVYDPDDWGVLLRTPSHWRVLFPIDPDQSNEDALDPDHLQERLQGVVALPQPYPIVHSTIYAVHQRVAATFGMGRVLLVGDSAHINNPLGGMGMNSGIHDADAAVQAIWYTIEGGDPNRAMQTYARVRRDAAMLDVQKSTHKNYEEMRQADDGRHAKMAETAADPRRARAHLRVASMLASFETSQRRMRRSLTPVHPQIPTSPGRRLSDSMRDWSLPTEHGEGPLTAVVLPAADVPAATDDIVAVVEAATGPLVAEVRAGADVADAVARYERAGVAAIEVSDTRSVAAAVAARHELLVVASVDGSVDAGSRSLTVSAASLAEAGADVVALTGPADTDLLESVHRAAPSVPLARTVGEGAVSDPLDLTLAGVGLLLDRSGAVAAARRPDHHRPPTSREDHSMPSQTSPRALFGLIVPSTNTVVEAEFNWMRPEGVSWHAGRIYIPNPVLDDDASFVEFLENLRVEIGRAVRDVVTADVDYLVMGMSAETFWGGKEGAETFAAWMQELSGGLEVTTGAMACKAALDAYGATRIGVITPYQPVGDQQVRTFFEDMGCEVADVHGLKCETATSIASVPPEDMEAAFRQVDGDDVDLLIQAGTNLPGVKVAADLEARIGKPVLSINTITAWHAYRTNGIDDKIEGFGSLLLEH